MPKFDKLIAAGKTQTRKEVRATQYPILNPLRLVEGPCSRLKCDHSHNKNPFDLGRPFVGALASFVVGVLLSAGFHSVYILLGSAAITAFLLAHEFCSEDWEAHKNDLAQLREPLLARTDGDHLAREVVRQISEVVDRLFGPQSDYASWLAMIEQRIQQVGIKTEVVTENAAELGGFRESAVRTYVRIISDNADLPSALAALEAFKTMAENELNRLRIKAEELKTAVEDLDRLRAMPGADISKSTAAMEHTIQSVVDHIFTALENLQTQTATAIQAAALATAGNYASSLQKQLPKTATEDPALADAKNAAAARSQKR